MVHPTRPSSRAEPTRHAPGQHAFITLDGMRGMAALAVAARHAPNLLWRIAGIAPAGDGTTLPPGPLYESHLAVDFFFVLSGFVIAYAYGDRLRRGMSPGRFMTARLIRVYPLYLLALALSLVVEVVKLRHGMIAPATLAIDVAAAVLFLPSPASPTGLFPLNFPAWSLFFELLANCVYALVGRRPDGRALVAIPLAAAALLLVAVPAGWLGFGTLNGAMDAGVDWASAGGGALRVGFGFFAGVLVHRLSVARPPRLRLPPLVPVAVLVALLFAWPPSWARPAYDLAATLLVFPALVYLGSASVPGRHLARLFTWLGGISYAVYVLQIPVYRLIGDTAAARLGIGWIDLSLLWGVVSMVALIVAASIADAWFDRPVRRTLTALVRRPTRLTA